MSEKARTEELLETRSSNQISERLNTSQYIDALSGLVKFGLIVRVFSLAIEQDANGFTNLLRQKENPIHKELAPFQINEGFIKKHTVPRLFPPDAIRSSWEKKVTSDYYPGDENHQIKTILDFDPQTDGLDDMLYRLYTRKICRLSIRESEKLCFARLKTFRGISLQGCGGTDNVRFDIGIYMMLKRRTDGKFSPVITISAIVTPSQDLEPAKKSEALIQATYRGPLERFEFVVRQTGKLSADFQDIERFMENPKEIMPIDDIMLFATVKYFLNPMNVSIKPNMKLPLANNNRVRRSSSLTGYLLSTPFSKVTIDPLESSASSTRVDIDVRIMANHILTLLGLSNPLLSDDGFSWFPSEDVRSRLNEIISSYEGDFTGYHLQQVNVSLGDYNKSTRKSVDKSLQTVPGDCDYNEYGALWTASWHVLQYSLITSQELLFTSYHEALSAFPEDRHSKTKLLKQLTEQAVVDFEEYYDVNAISRDVRFFKREYEALKEVNLIDDYYNTLLEKRNLLNAEVAEEQRKNEKYALFLAMASLVAFVLVDLISRLH